MSTSPLKKKSPGKAQKKSGLRVLKAGENLFHENDNASSLYIIQKGQLRLFRPKGKGFIELAILRAGEVIGEMAYFDEGSRRRSCSADAMIETEIIEISFNAFGKTLEGLNPWFKTIINTLADRLRKTNEKVKELESNSVGFAAGGKVANYKFFNNADIVKMLSVLFLAFKAHGEVKDGRVDLHKDRLKFYMKDIFAIMEVKYEEFINLLETHHLIKIAEDENKLPKILRVQDVNVFKQQLAFFNSQRMVADDKKLIISNKCERFLKRVLDQFSEVEEKKDKMMAKLSPILDDFKMRNVPISEEDLRDALDAGLMEDIMVGEGNTLTSVVNYKELRKTFPSIVLMNAIKKVNDSKSS